MIHTHPYIKVLVFNFQPLLLLHRLLIDSSPHFYFLIFEKRTFLFFKSSCFFGILAQNKQTCPYFQHLKTFIRLNLHVFLDLDFEFNYYILNFFACQCTFASYEFFPCNQSLQNPLILNYWIHSCLRIID